MQVLYGQAQVLLPCEIFFKTDDDVCTFTLGRCPAADYLRKRKAALSIFILLGFVPGK